MGIFVLFLNMGTWKTKFAPQFPHSTHHNWLNPLKPHVAKSQDKLPFFKIIVKK
jgi:hypothetical protein